jgi:hypothetical protein
MSLIADASACAIDFAFDTSTEPLCNLFVRVLNKLGLDDQAFGTSTGRLAGLEIG